MTPPPVCPRCASDRVGVMDDRATYDCGTVYVNDRIRWVAQEQAKCQSELIADAQMILERPDVLRDIKRYAWRRGAEAMRNCVRAEFDESNVPSRHYNQILDEVPLPEYFDA